MCASTNACVHVDVFLLRVGFDILTCIMLYDSLQKNVQAHICHMCTTNILVFEQLASSGGIMIAMNEV